MKRLAHKLAALALLSTAALAPVASAEAAFVPKVAGTWEIIGTPDAPPPGETSCGPANPFSNFASITLAGALTTVDPVLGTGVGEAFRNGRKTYGVGFFLTASPAPGVFINVEVQGALELVNKDEGAGRFRTILSDPVSGAPFCVYEGALVAFRLQPTAY